MALDGPERELHPLGNLRVRQLIEERQTQDRRGRLTEAGQLIGHEDTVHRLVDGGMARVLWGRVGRVRLSGAAFEMIGDPSSGDRDEPAGQAASSGVEGRASAPRGDEDLLCDVGCLVGIPEDPACCGVDQR